MGRAFVTLTLDTQTRKLQVKIAAAKWMFPMDPLRAEKTQNQMLANVGDSNKDIPFLDLIPDELATLSLPNTRYNLILASSQLVESRQKSALIELSHQEIFNEYLNDDYLPDLLIENDTYSLFKGYLIIKICALSFYERYAEFIKAFPEEYGKRPHVMAIITR